MITALYASLLALLLFVLSIRVIGLRGNPIFAFIAQGKGDEALFRGRFVPKVTSPNMLRPC